MRFGYTRVTVTQILFLMNIITGCRAAKAEMRTTSLTEVMKPLWHMNHVIGTHFTGRRAS